MTAGCSEMCTPAAIRRVGRSNWLGSGVVSRVQHGESSNADTVLTSVG